MLRAPRPSVTVQVVRFPRCVSRALHFTQAKTFYNSSVNSANCQIHKTITYKNDLPCEGADRFLLSRFLCHSRPPACGGIQHFANVRHQMTYIFAFLAPWKVTAFFTVLAPWPRPRRTLRGHSDPFSVSFPRRRESSILYCYSRPFVANVRHQMTYILVLSL